MRQRVALVAPPLAAAFNFIFSLLEQSVLDSCIPFSLSSSVLDRSHLSVDGTAGCLTWTSLEKVLQRRNGDPDSRGKTKGKHNLK